MPPEVSFSLRVKPTLLHVSWPNSLGALTWSPTLWLFLLSPAIPAAATPASHYSSNPPDTHPPQGLCPEYSFATISNLHPLPSHSPQVSHQMRDFPWPPSCPNTPKLLTLSYLYSTPLDIYLVVNLFILSDFSSKSAPIEYKCQEVRGIACFVPW